ncbi:MAG: hypothetical protein PHO26_00445 [Dehalococcoidia bacterium]|nr:hypothetical protein [Dehalococcoidia bacterium]MDD5493867.1 hypothetical protein [Dehalococcoidia bacterium]
MKETSPRKSIRKYVRMSSSRYLRTRTVFRLYVKENGLTRRVNPLESHVYTVSGRVSQL